MTEQREEYYAFVSKDVEADLQEHLRKIYPHRLPGESFAQYVKRWPKAR